jgi:hypothetical protein
MMRVHERRDLLLFQSFEWQVSSLKVITKNMGWCGGDATAAVEGQNLQLTFEVSKSCVILHPFPHLLQ